MHPNAQIVFEPGSRRVEVRVMVSFQIEDGQIIAHATMSTWGI